MEISPVSSPSSTLQPASDKSFTKSWASTKVKIKKCDFLWTIDNFSYICEEIGTGKFLQSPTFPADINDKLKWNLHLYPNGPNVADKNFVSLFLSLHSHNQTELCTKFKFSIVNACKEETNTKHTDGVYRFSTAVKNGGWSKFILRNFLLDKANAILSGGILTLICEVSVFVTVNTSGDFRTIPVPECLLSDNLGELFKEQKLGDVILSCNGSEFTAHKAILTARSPVFSAMFENEMEEKKQNRVEITDMDPEVLGGMLHYIYTGKVSNMENRPEELLMASNKYGLDRLKVMCEEHISKNLSVDNVPETLILANVHRAKHLEANVIAFINIHVGEVITSDGWQAMVQSQPVITAEVLRTLTVLQLTPPTDPPLKKRKL